MRESDGQGKVILVGGGHAHLELLRLARNDRAFLDRVVLISKEKKTYYSGMISAWIEGLYGEDEISIDLEALAQGYGVPFICSGVQKIDFCNSAVVLENQETVRFDIASVDIGSTAPVQQNESGSSKAFYIKPFSRLASLKANLALVPQGIVLVIGSGAAALKVALAFGASKQGFQGEVILLTHPAGILPTGSARIQRKFRDRLNKNPRITVVSEDGAFIEPGRVVTPHRQWNVDMVVWATGPVADSLFAVSGIKTDPKGYMLVDQTLRSTSVPTVFGAGDCIAMEGEKLAKNGVNAVREAPILYHNIRAQLLGGAFLPYEPKTPQLAIFSTGERNGILQYGSLVISGRVPWLLKSWIDLRYMRKHRLRTQ